MAQEDSKQTEMSVIATFHHEGAIAHKTVQNIFQLVAPLRQQGISYEIIFHIDNGDPETTNYLERFRQDEHIRIFKNSFGNPSDSRNFCAQQARGQYLAVLDGDDIFSENWLIDGYRILRGSRTPLILHTEANITFGNDNPDDMRIWFMSDSRSDREDVANMFTRNRWSAGTILPRAVALQFPYRYSHDGFGYEDWLFNMDTRHAGILHKVVPKSVEFYRVRKNSVYSMHTSGGTITEYSEMFNTEAMQKLAKAFANKTLPVKSPNTKSQRIARLAKNALKTGERTLSALPGVGGLARRGLNVNSRRRGRNVFKKLPQYVQDAWIAANQLDGEAWPDPSKISKLYTYDSDFNDLTALYCRLISQIRKNPDYLFLPPQLSVGGTEKVLANYLNAFAELHPDWHIVVLAALPKNHPYKFPDNVDFVDFYGLMQGYNDFEVDFVLSRFIIQTQVKRLHVIHNELAFRWAKNHLNLLKNSHYRLYISQFMDEYHKDPRLVVGFVDPWIRDLSPAITKVLTDNIPFANIIIERTGLPADKVVAHFQPTAPLTYRPHNTEKTPPYHILWASRVSPQKRPDLLKQIASHLDPTRYVIDVYGRLQRPYSENYFKDKANITYKGTYNGIESLDLSSYDAFLYTSQTDGLPNILLEIATSGLPIVASNVGGVGDIVTESTGYPVEMENIDGYVKALRQITENPAEAEARAEAACNLVLSRHTWSQFLTDVERDIN